MSIKSAFIVPHPPLLLPEVGGGQETQVSKTIKAYEKVAGEIAAISPETIILISPHSIMYADYIHISPGRKATGNFHAFGEYTVSISAEYDEELVSEISAKAGEKGIFAGPMGEKQKTLDHGTMVPLYFINKRYQNYKLVRISISGLSFREHYAFGRCVKESIEALGRKAVIVASGDLSHCLSDDGPYHFTEEGPEFDHAIVEAMKTADFLSFLRFDESFCQLAGECGLRSFIIMAGILDGMAVEPEFLSYEDPFGVGYAVAGFRVLGSDDSRHFDVIFEEEETKRLVQRKEKEDELVRLARLSLEHYVNERKPLSEKPKVSAELRERKAGVFVSLKKDGKLRGCIGTTSPTTESIAQEIMQNAVSAGVGDPRFEPVSKEELPQLVYSVDVLGESEPIDSKDMLDPNRYGVIVQSGRKKALLLPQLDGIKTIDQQMDVVLKKAGIDPEDDYSLRRFEVVRHL